MSETGQVWPTPTVEGSGRTEVVGDYPAKASDAELIVRLEEVAEDRERESRHPGLIAVEQWEAGRDALAIREACRRLTERVPSPTAARGVTGLPTWEEVTTELRKLLYAQADKAEARGADFEAKNEEYEQRRQAMFTTLRTLLSAAEQGERDREDAELLAWLEAQEGDVEADLRPAGLPVASEAWHEVAIRWKQDGALPTLPIRDVLHVARQPRQEGDR